VNANESITRLRGYPPVSRLTTHGQWLVVACVLLLSSILKIDNISSEANGYGWQVFELDLLYAGWLLALTWTVWYTLDRTPLVAGRRHSWLTTRGQWIIVVIYVLLLSSILKIDYISSEANGYAWQVFGLELLYAGWLLALTWTVWCTLDRTPFASGRRWRNGAFRVLLGGVAMALDLRFFSRLLRVGLFRIGLFSKDRYALLQLLGTQETALEIAGFSLAIYLFVVFAYMRLQRSHEQQQQLALERSLAETRLHALSLELQPHFLFNAMNGIAALVRDNPIQAERMLLRLSDLLRLTLRGSPDGRISLRQELEQLDLYLDLQLMRFGSRLTVTREVDPAALDGQVPHMLLQPLVENALTHGIAPRIGPGRVALTARYENGALVLKVCDNGAGLPPASDRRERTGIGTTRMRLAAMFGDNQNFTLTPAEGGGTEVTIRIPFLPVSA